MKGNKKILIVAVLLLLFAISYGTYAIYKSSATSSDSIRAAHWVVKVNNGDIVSSNNFTLGGLNCGGESSIGKNGTFAPGDTCTATIEVDATGSEVAVDYTVTVDSSALTTNNNKITVTADTNHDPLTGNIPYSATAGAMKKTIVLNVTWAAVDSEEQNTTDVNTALNADLEIPVTVSVVQSPTGI